VSSQRHIVAPRSRRPLGLAPLVGAVLGSGRARRGRSSLLGVSVGAGLFFGKLAMQSVQKTLRAPKALVH
jgi:hypothetical protein